MNFNSLKSIYFTENFHYFLNKWNLSIIDVSGVHKNISSFKRDFQKDWGF